MNYLSTRGQTRPHSFSEAVRVGLAPDGGLFVPERFPDLSDEMLSWKDLSYPQLCYEFLKHFADDIEANELKGIVESSYGKFDHPDRAPLVKLSDSVYILELFHGPTLAFKDFALQLLGNLYERQVRVTGEPITVLGATSGDTGAAAISGLLGKEGVNIFILYPDGRVAPLQERQMTCTEAANVFPLAVSGSFDDAQTALKEVFGDREFSKKVGLSAVNSINIARVLAQCVYYIYAWLQLPEDRREKTTYVVPTGNFGNVLAGWMASAMGMKVAGFRVATNQNDILHRFFSQSDYSVGDVEPSVAPSMDIQIASNFERFLYFGLGQDADKTRQAMQGFKQNGVLDIKPSELRLSMSSSRMDDKEILDTIQRVRDESDYLVDSHTACAFKDLDGFENAVVLATAHPAKFPDAIRDAVGEAVTHPTLETLKAREIVKYPLSPNAESIKDCITSHI